MARGRRRRQARAEDVAALSNERQIALDFDPTAKVGTFDALADLQRRINALDHERKLAADGLRTLRKEREALLNQAAAGKRTETVEIEDRPDFEAGIVTTHRKDTGEVIPNGERRMTEAEKESGVVHTGDGPKSRISTPDAKVSLAEVAAHVEGNGNLEASIAAGETSFPVAPFPVVPEEEEYPLPSSHPADVAAVIRVAHRGGATTEEEAWVG